MDNPILAIAVDDEEVNLNLINELSKEAGISTALFTSPTEALIFSADNDIDMAFVDYKMPEMNGVDFIKKLREKYPNIPIVMITMIEDYDMMVEAINVGATEFVAKPINSFELLARIRNLAALRYAQLELHRKNIDLLDIIESAKATSATETELLLLAGEMSEVKICDSLLHCKRISAISSILCEGAGIAPPEKDLISNAIMLHDAGMIFVPEAFASKESPLTDDEFATVKRHCFDGQEILLSKKSALFTRAAEIALTHHERMDGSGYPYGIKGGTIPLSGRIAAIADSFDSMVSLRHYHKPAEFTQARQHFEENSGKLYDPGLTKILLSGFSRIKSLYK